MNTLHEALNSHTVSSLKELIANFAHASGVGRKEILIGELLQQMSDEALPHLWERLDPCQRLAVGEAVHSGHGFFDGERFAAKYGQVPMFYHPSVNKSYRSEGPMNLLSLFLYECGQVRVMPADLRARLRAFVPAPAPNALTAWADLPERHPDDDDDIDPTPMTVRSTAPDALHDVVAMLRTVDHKQIAVSDKTRLPGVAALRLVAGKLAGDDFYQDIAPADEWEQQIGPIKAFAWPLLLQAGGLAQLNGSKLALSPAGVKALKAAPADMLRGIWRTWLASTLFDEFSRVDEIKGQKGKGAMTPTAPRRALVSDVLRRCPVERWVSVDELSRFMRAEGYPLEVCHDAGCLYVGDAHYGNLLYGGSDMWDLLQMRYLLCVLFEYCATLGMVDVAYRSPHDARGDFVDLWAAQDMTFLSRYDGLRYFRLTALGAYCLGLSESYTPAERAATCALSVQASLQVSVTAGALSAEECLMLDNWAVRDTDRLWRLDSEKAIAAIERGHDTAQLEAFLQARDSQPLPPQVESFLRTCNKQGKAMTVLAASLLIECIDAPTADLIAAHKDVAPLCMRAGERHLVVRQDRESKFRKAVRLLGYGIAI